MKIIKLISTSFDHQGNPINFNPDWIVCVFPLETDGGGSLRTIVYGGPMGDSWEVEESPEKIKRLIGKK